MRGVQTLGSLRTVWECFANKGLRRRIASSDAPCRAFYEGFRELISSLEMVGAKHSGGEVLGFQGRLFDRIEMSLD